MNRSYITIPKPISWICQQRLQNSSKTFQQILDYTSRDKAFKIILNKILLQDHSQKNDLTSRMNAYGVKGIRDRLASYYIASMLEGITPIQSDLSYLIEVQQFEERFSLFSSEWESRVFMLGFYLRIFDIFNEQNNDHESFEIHLDLDIDEILLIGKPKIEKLDWLMLTLKSALRYKTKDELISWFQKDGVNFHDFLSIFSSEHREQVVRDLLMYGHAINESDFFIFDKV